MNKFSFELDANQARRRALRYLNLFRLIIAAVFLFLGAQIMLGSEATQIFWFTALAYVLTVLAFGFPDAENRIGYDRLVAIQGITDVVFLNVIMWTSGGYHSGIPVLMMIMLAGSGLIAGGRTVLFMASLATLGVLGENVWRTLHLNGKAQAADFFQVALTCTAFFIIAIVARLLAKRARLNASLAAERGAALAQQEAINAHIIHDMRDGIIVLRADGIIRQANPSACQLLGCDSVEDRPLAEVSPALAEYCRAGAKPESGQVVQFGQSQRLLRCLATSSLDDDESKNNSNEGDMLIFLTDFDEIQRSMQQLKLVSLGRLTASMAHEIRNPLSAISQAAELLCEEKRGDMQLRLAHIINDNSKRIDRMIRDVLALGRRDRTQPEALPLAEFVAELFETFILGGENEKTIFCADIEPGITLGIDRAHLHQILDNLLSNARRYCSGKPGSICVSAQKKGTHEVQLHVRDDGPGVDEQTRAHLFEPFFTSHTKGTGLGLYIARELAEANGFSLELADDSLPRAGAHFILTGQSQP
ncbi:MAG: PAS domain-containing protein [Azoarcus sp.]|jgi:two-component system sensor histidine kinase PilS (NtrC family)|nr:PAS domain-containing protein [Azoarcus sp.]